MVVTPEALDPHETASSAPKTSGQPRAFRKDIQGLRAIAVGAVVLFHLWPKRMPGGFVGVDIFLVISGFLITSHLIKKPPTRLSGLTEFWARRVSRLLPASLLVLTVTAWSAMAVAPISTWKDTAKQIVASVLYVQNWALAGDSVDYLAADNSPTAVQHFWSLSVEEQFYFMWPIIIGVAVFVAVRRRWPVLRVLFVVLAVVIAASFAYNLWLVTSEPALAYFVTPGRIWELVAGGLLAAVAAERRGGGSTSRAVLAWFGIAGIITSFFVISPADPFPGYVAVLPVVSTVLVIYAHSTSHLSPTGLLSWRPVQLVGDTSYSIYLWHWPLIVLLSNVVGELWWGEKLGIIAVTIGLAWLTMKFVEQRFRSSRFFQSKSRTYLTAGLAMIIAAASGLTLYAAASLQQSTAQDSLQDAIASGNPCLGAGALLMQESDPAACPDSDTLLLDPVSARADKSRAYEDDCWTWQPYGGRKTCTYGDGATHIALVGNSHAGHWLPALEPIATQRDWTITTFLVDRCNPSTARQDFDTQEKADGCFAYGQWVLDETTSGKFDAIVSSERQSLPVQGFTFETTEKAAAEGYIPFLSAWADAGVPVLIIRDTPFPGNTVPNIPDCVAQFGTGSPECAGTPESWAWPDPLTVATKDLGIDNQYVIDPTAWLCPDGICHSSIGQVITFFDASHITATYARTMSPMLVRAIDELDDPVFGISP